MCRSLTRRRALSMVGATLVAFVATLVPAQAAECDRALRVAVDVGHSPVAPGAKSAGGKYEYEFNRRMATELVEAGRNERHQFILIDAASRAGLELRDRPRQARAENADLFVSIHHDYLHSKYLKEDVVDGRKRTYSNAFRGFSAFVSPENPDYSRSVLLAQLIASRFKEAGMSQTLHHAEPIENENRKILHWDLGIYEAPFVVIKTATMPAVLLELGVLAHPEEEARLEDPTYRSRIAEGILSAIREYCRINPPEPKAPPSKSR